MPTQLATNVWLRVVGESRFITIDMSADLEDGQTITAIADPTVGSALATYVASSKAISSNGLMVSAKFTSVTAGQVKVTFSMTTSNPTETLYAVAYLQQE